MEYIFDKISFEDIEKAFENLERDIEMEKKIELEVKQLKLLRKTESNDSDFDIDNKLYWCDDNVDEEKDKPLIRQYQAKQ